MAEKLLRQAYGEALLELGSIRDDVMAVDADLSHVTMTSLFGQRYPDRFYNFGIAESNMMGAASGLALSGYTVFASTFSIFGLGRAYEIVRNAICYTGANVKLALTHGGLTPGEDGGSHQAIEDIALARVLPNMTILSPCDVIQTHKAVFAAAAIDGPVYLRISRLENGVCTNSDTPFEVGKANILRDGTDLTIFATGLMTPQAIKVASILDRKGIHARVVDFHTIKPIDRECIIRCASECEHLFSLEEHSIIGGLGSAIAEVLAEVFPKNLYRIGINDRFGRSGKPMELWKAYGLEADQIASRIIEII